MYETRHAFRETLGQLEHQTLGGLDLVMVQLDRALETVGRHDPALTGVVVADDDLIDQRYQAVHEGILRLLATQAPVAGDLRVVAALLHVVRCVERMGDQCVNIAKLVPLSGHESPHDSGLLEMVERAGSLARSQVALAKTAFAARDEELARRLARQDEAIDLLNRRVFSRAVEIGDDPELREWATFMVLVGRALERIGDNAVDIGEQTLFVITGQFRELSDASHSIGDEGVPQ